MISPSAMKSCSGQQARSVSSGYAADMSLPLRLIRRIVVASPTIRARTPSHLSSNCQSLSGRSEMVPALASIGWKSSGTRAAG